METSSIGTAARLGLYSASVIHAVSRQRLRTQPTQPERYKARAGELTEGAQMAYCVLVASKKYSEGNSAAVHFDAVVSDEELASAISSI